MTCPAAKSQQLIIGNKTVDISKFCPKHPGGPIICEFNSKDATDVFLAMHGPNSRAHRLVNELPVIADDTLAAPDVSAVQHDFRHLAKQMHVQYNTFRPKLIAKWFFELSITIALFFITPVVILYKAKSLKGTRFVIGAILLGIGLFQLGWISHDLSHKQVITDHRLLQPVIHFYGNIIGGYSYDWWRKKHNQMHHPSTNVIGIDEDIDTMPLIAWDEQLATESNHFVRNQHKYVWITLMFARLYWRWRSLQHVIEQRQYKELLFLLIHYLLYALFVASLGISLVASVIFVLAVEIIAGFGTAFVFIQSHNGKEVTANSNAPIHGDFWSHQLNATTNIRPSWFTNYVSGYLNLQIEHHLFPWMPRQLLLEVRPHVQRICKKHKLLYREYNWLQSTRIVYNHLRTIAYGAARKANQV